MLRTEDLGLFHGELYYDNYYVMLDISSCKLMSQKIDAAVGILAACEQHQDRLFLKQRLTIRISQNLSAKF